MAMSNWSERVKFGAKSATLSVCSDLDLDEINVPNVNKNVIIPEEVNVYLRQQLCDAIKENEALKDDISTKNLYIEDCEQKIRDITQKNKEYEGFCNDNPYVSATQLTQSKLVELSKKLRDRNSELEVYKTKCSKLEKNVSQLQAQIEPVTNKDNDSKEVVPNELEPNEIKRLQDKLNYTMNKLLETKDLNSKLKHDLKLANKWLQQEVGDNFEVLLSQNSNSNWRGRAQIICDLQQKNSDLRKELKEIQGKGNSTDSSKILKSETNKKLDNLSKENVEIKQNFQDLGRKFEATKARCKVLESECAVLRTKVRTNDDNYKRDQQLIASLSSQLAKGGSERLEAELRHKEEMVKSLQQKNEALSVKLAKEKCSLENKCKEIQLKDEEIEVLTKRARSSRPSSSYGQRRENPDALTISRLEAERLKLLELTEIQNKRLEDERDAHFRAQNQLRFEKQRGAKLEANLARLELEQNCGRNSYRARENNTKQPDQQSLKDQLELAEEAIKALNTRLEIETYERKEFTAKLKDYMIN